MCIPAKVLSVSESDDNSDGQSCAGLLGAVGTSSTSSVGCLLFLVFGIAIFLFCAGGPSRGTLLLVSLTLCYFILKTCENVENLCEISIFSHNYPCNLNVLMTKCLTFPVNNSKFR